MAFKVAASMATKKLAEVGGAELLEPMMQVEVVTPEENMGDVVGDLNRRRGLIQGMDENAAGKIVSKAPYKSKEDMYSKAGFSAPEAAAVKKYDSNFIFLEPRPEYIIDNINNGLYR